MRRISPKQQKLNRTYREDRKAFLVEFPVCWFCGAKSTEVHELANGNGIRNLAFGDRAAWCAACRRCNTHELTDKAKYPIARQLAVKLLRDPNYFDLSAINAMRGRAPTATTLADVVEWLEVRSA